MSGSLIFHQETLFKLEQKSIKNLDIWHKIYDWVKRTVPFDCPFIKDHICIVQWNFWSFAISAWITYVHQTSTISNNFYFISWQLPGNLKLLTLPIELSLSSFLLIMKHMKMKRIIIDKFSVQMYCLYHCCHLLYYI